MSNNSFLASKIQSLQMTISGLRDNIKTVNNTLKDNTKNSNDIQLVLLEVLKSNKRIEEAILEQNELIKVQLGLPSKYDGKHEYNKVLRKKGTF